MIWMESTFGVGFTDCLIDTLRSNGGWWEARWQSGNARLSGSQESRFESGPVPKLIWPPASRADWGDIFY